MSVPIWLSCFLRIPLGLRVQNRGFWVPVWDPLDFKLRVWGRVFRVQGAHQGSALSKRSYLGTELQARLVKPRSLGSASKVRGSATRKPEVATPSN